MEIKEPIRKTHVEKIILCHRCNGEGTERIFNDKPGYEGPWVQPCDMCKGHGRLWMKLKTELYLFT